MITLIFFLLLLFNVNFAKEKKDKIKTKTKPNLFVDRELHSKSSKCFKIAERRSSNNVDDEGESEDESADGEPMDQDVDDEEEDSGIHTSSHADASMSASSSGLNRLNSTASNSSVNAGLVGGATSIPTPGRRGASRPRRKRTAHIQKKRKRFKFN